MEDDGQSDGKLKVVATIFPIYDFARNIGGDRVNVTMLLPPATDAHNYELKPEDIVKAQNKGQSINAYIKEKSGTAPESVTVGGKSYDRPAGMTDAQWNSYKSAMGIKQ